MDPIRAFVALTPDPPWAPALAQLLEQLRGIPGASAIRWAKPEQVHLTLRFLGNMTPNETETAIRRLETACRGFVPFPLEPAGLGCFPNPKHPRVLWLGLEDATGALANLQRSMAHHLADLGDHREAKAFRPHLTLGRLRADARGAPLDFTRLPPRPEIRPWLVQSVEFMRSELNPSGARHSLIYRQNLLPPGP